MKTKFRSRLFLEAATALLSGLLLAVVAGQDSREVAPDIRQSWEDDYASLKAALSNRDNRYTLLRTGDERKDVAHIQSLIWESDRTPADVALRRAEALLRHLKGMPKAPELEALEKQLATAKSRNAEAADDKETYLSVRAIGRAAVLANPLLDFDGLIFNRWCICYWFDASNNNDGLGPYGGYRSTPLQFGFARSRLGKALLATHAEWVKTEDLRRIMLWLDLNAMRLGTPTLDADEQRAQETGDGTYQWPPEIDPKNPTGVERDRDLPGSTGARTGQ